MSSLENTFNEAKKLHNLGKIRQAQELYEKILKIRNDNFLIFNLYATTFLQLKKFNKAIENFSKSINLNPNFADNFNNRGIAYAEVKNYKMAISDYDQAINLKKNYFNAYLNKAIALNNYGKFNESISCFNICIKINPSDPKIYNSLGNLYAKIDNLEQALKAYDKAIDLKKSFDIAYSNRGDIRLKQKKYELALDDYSSALKINRNLDNVYGKYINTEMKINKWDDFHKHLKNLKEIVNVKKGKLNPFDLLSLIDDPKLHKKAAARYSKIQNLKNPKKINNIKINEKIKIGYFSADFKSHAVLYLMFDVFKNHDKKKFEIFGFNHSKHKTKLTTEISKHFDRFYDCSDLSDKEIALLSRENNINIAINLTGHTSDSRDGIYQYDPAPIKVNYLGYPGTMGSDCYNYIIADRIVIPKDKKKDFFEKVVYLPECYQPNQAEINLSNINISKRDVGLPENSFVFGCLNNNYKITPDIFKSWMEILKNTENSILWLLVNEEIAKKNIEKEAEKYGVNKNRIFYAQRLQSKKHLKRLKHIDLFLDTFPYNAHTTAKEAIRAGVPIVTLIGNSFASRVAGSILTNIGLKKLITRNIEEYTRLAIDIRNDKNKLKNIKNYLNRPEIIKKIHNFRKFTKDLEKIYTRMVYSSN